MTSVFPKCMAVVAMVVVAAAATVGHVHAQGINADLISCDASNPNQQWMYHPGSDNHIVLKHNGWCLDVEDYGTTPGSNVWTFLCHPSDKSPAHQNQAWQMKSDGTIISTLSGLCVSIIGGAVNGTNVQLGTCTSGDAKQQWSIDSSTGLITNKATSLCLDAGTPYVPPGPCDSEPAKSKPFCDYTLSFEDRVANLISLLDQSEKIGLFQNGAAAVPSWNLPAYQWWSEALHGVAYSPGVHMGGAFPYATSFPQVILTASGFNRTKFHAISTAIGTEGRAMNNYGHAGLTFWAPNINIYRDPRWGRGQETPGEDPYLNGAYVTEFVNGMQDGVDDAKHLKVSSCCKHYDAYSLEDWHGVDRHHFNAVVTQQDLNDTYLPAWQACVEDGHASAIMCSYNEVNGVPSCANKWLMTDKARNDWGFQGYITSDCGAVDNVLNTHHYTKTPEQTCKVTLEAGMDIDCGGFLVTNLQQAISSGAVSQADIDTALTNQFMVQFRLGLFDPVDKQPYKALGAKDVNTKAHQELALDAAREGIVLLQNTDGALPLSTSSVKNVALVGPNANATSVMQGNYYGAAPYLISPVEGTAMYASASYTQGCTIAGTDTSGIAAAAAAAAAADATFVVIGLDQTQEREGHDRVIVALPGVQNQLVETVCAKSKGPCVVVVMSGGPVDLTAVKSNKDVAAIVWVGYPGQSGGQAMADVIFGKIVPSGRLVTTWVPADYIDNVSMFNMNMRPNVTANYPGRTYRFYTGDVVFPFGFGLSYTTFEYKWSSATTAATSVSEVHRALGVKTAGTWGAPVTTVSVTVTNTGKVAATTSVLAFVKPPHPGVGGAPLRSLANFDKVGPIAPGDSVTVHLDIPAAAFTYGDATSGERRGVPGVWRVVVEDAELPIVVADA